MNYLIDIINKNYSYLMEALTDLNSVYYTSNNPPAHKTTKYNGSSWMHNATEGFVSQIIENYTQMGAKFISDIMIKPAINTSLKESMNWIPGYKPNNNYVSYSYERLGNDYNNQFNPYNLFPSYINTDNSPRSNTRKSENLANNAIDMMANSAKQCLDSWTLWYKNIT
jgi:hypothetical protein